MASVQTECSICYDAVIDYPAPEGAEATGSHRSSCGHLFHPKCISKWHLSQQESTCPMCRKKAVEMEDCAPEEESEAESDDEDEEDFDEGGLIRITRVGMDYVMRQHGGLGVLAGVEAEVGFDEYGQATITRYEFQRILREQGGNTLSDAQWTQLTSVYPPAEHDDDDDEVVAGAMALGAAPRLTFAEWEPEASPPPLDETDPTQRARDLLANPAPPASVVTPEDMEAWELVLDSARATLARHAAASLRYHSSHHPCPLEHFPAGDIPPAYGVAACVICNICDTDPLTTSFYHCVACQFDVCATCFSSTAPPVEEVVHAPGPFDIVDGQEGDEGQWVNLSRQAVEDLLQGHGSMATAIEFFNEEGEPPSEQTIMITMTLQSLNNRFASLGARPVTLAETLAAEARSVAVITPPPTPSQEDSLERSAVVALVSMAGNHTTSLQITAFADGTREVAVKPRSILNPEDE
jgi:hypothetical protein